MQKRELSRNEFTVIVNYPVMMTLDSFDRKSLSAMVLLHPGGTTFVIVVKTSRPGKYASAERQQNN